MITDCELPETCPLEVIFGNKIWINRFQLEDIDNNSGRDGGNGDFTNFSTPLNKGETYTATIEVGLAEMVDYYGKVWIDFNKDGDFEEEGEEVSTFKNETTISITIPSTASTGLMRMRIALADRGGIEPCGSRVKFGEVEDYSIKIRPETTLQNTPNYSLPTSRVKESTANNQINLYPNPTREMLTVAFNSPLESDGQLRIYNSFGQVVSQQTIKPFTTPSLHLSVEQLPKGIYYLGVKIEGKPEMVEKFTKL